MPGCLIITSADVEWSVVRNVFSDVQLEPSPRTAPAYGDSFVTPASTNSGTPALRFMHGGWGKVSAAASTQWAIDRWCPDLIANLGTCGGFAGEVERGDIVLAERTVVYDIVERMFDPDEAIADRSVDMDLSLVEGLDLGDVTTTTLVSADRDLDPDEVPALRERFGAVVGDWESGAIAWTAARNGVPCVILRGVSDCVGPAGGDSYDDDGDMFLRNTDAVMRQLVRQLPRWIGAATNRARAVVHGRDTDGT